TSIESAVKLTTGAKTEMSKIKARIDADLDRAKALVAAIKATQVETRLMLVDYLAQQYLAAGQPGKDEAADQAMRRNEKQEERLKNIVVQLTAIEIGDDRAVLRDAFTAVKAALGLPAAERSKALIAAMTLLCQELDSGASLNGSTTASVQSLIAKDPW